MKRTICPQVAGIYTSNEVQPGAVFGYLLIPSNYPNDEFTSIYAHSCDKNGELDPNRKFKTIYAASAFGEFIKTI